MERIHSKLRRTDYYDFGHGLTLMNVLSKTEDGKLDRIDTYIGVEGNEFVCVGCAKDLSAPGVIFSYGEYVRFQRANKATYLDQAYDIITLLSNQTKKIPLAKFKDKPISFDLKGLLG